MGIKTDSIIFAADNSTQTSALNLRSKMVTATRDISITGDQTISGVGFTASVLIIAACIDGAAASTVGVLSANGSMGSIYGNFGGVPGVWGQSGQGVYISVAGGGFYLVSCTFNADGAVLNWAKGSSPTGTLTFHLLFLG